MGRGGAGTKHVVASSSKAKPIVVLKTPMSPMSPTSPTSPINPSGIRSTTSISSGETVKAVKVATKSTLKDILGQGGNNKNVAKPSKDERVYMSGRGGARKGPKPVASTGPTNAQKIEALLAASRLDSGTPEDGEGSSRDSTSTGTQSNKTKSTLKSAVSQVLGGGGNDHGLWKHDPHFVHSFGRGGAYRAPSSSCGADIEIISDGRTSASSMSIARNSNGLFFFGRGRRCSSEEGEGERRSFLFVGPGEGIIHPTKPGEPFKQNGKEFPSDSALTRSSMHKSGMSKISIKIAVKEVLGGGGNDDGEWKYVDVFYPGYGRGGEGARGFIALDHIFNPHHYSFHFHGRSRSASTVSFPSISSDTSSVYANSVMSGYSSHSSVLDDDEGTHDSFDSLSVLEGDSLINRLAEADRNSPHVHFDESTASESDGRLPLKRASSGAAVHSDELLRFRDAMQAGRQPRAENPRPVRRNSDDEDYAVPEGQSIRVRSSRPKFSAPGASDNVLPQEDSEYSAGGEDPTLPPPPSRPAPLPALKSSPAVRSPQAVPPFQAAPLPAMSNGAADAQALARAIALIQAGSQLLKSVQQQSVPSPTRSQTQLHMEQEQRALKRERELLAARVMFLKQEVQRREKTIEGLTWLIGNLPEHEGKEIMVDLQHGDVHPEMVAAMQEAEDVLQSYPPAYLSRGFEEISEIKGGVADNTAVAA